MSLYYKYRGVGFSCNQFLKLVKEHPDEFIHYCEILVTENGIVFLACPNHEQTERLLTQKGFSNLLWVWYDNLKWGTLTDAQFKVLQSLRQNLLINQTIWEMAILLHDKEKDKTIHL